MRDEQQIKEMARDICRVQPSCNDVCNPAECCTAWKYANRAYDAGYRKQEWISVEDRLPEESDDYIVNLHSPSGANIVTKRSYSKTRGWYGVSSDYYYLETAVTHWMPFPAPPTEKEN